MKNNDNHNIFYKIYKKDIGLLKKVENRKSPRCGIRL